MCIFLMYSVSLSHISSFDLKSLCMCAIVDLYAIQMVSVMSCANIYENNNFMLQNKMIIGMCSVSFGARGIRVISHLC
jgi:hypothetical protein